MPCMCMCLCECYIYAVIADSRCFGVLDTAIFVIKLFMRMCVSTICYDRSISSNAWESIP